MQQPDSLSQLAQSVTNFLEPLFPYIITGTKKAAEEAVKKLGSEVWEKGKNLWDKFSSHEQPELEEAARNMTFSSTDIEVKQAFTQEVLKTLQENSTLAEEIASMMENSVIQRVIATNNSVVENVKQNAVSNAHQEVIADNSIIKGVEQTRNA